MNFNLKIKLVTCFYSNMLIVLDYDESENGNNFDEGLEGDNSIQEIVLNEGKLRVFVLDMMFILLHLLTYNI